MFFHKDLQVCLQLNHISFLFLFFHLNFYLNKLFFDFLQLRFLNLGFNNRLLFLGFMEIFLNLIINWWFLYRLLFWGNMRCYFLILDGNFLLKHSKFR